MNIDESGQMLMSIGIAIETECVGAECSIKNTESTFSVKDTKYLNISRSDMIVSIKT